MHGQSPETPDALCDALCFSALPETQLFKQGETVIIVLSIYTRSAKPIFVSRLTDGDFVNLSVIGPDGKELPRQGPISSGAHSPSDFATLETYHEISARRIISLKDGAGLVFDKPGQYFVTAEYSLGPPESFAPFAGEAAIPTGTFRSTKAGFCIEACIREPLPVHSNTSQSALDTVRVFYTDVTKYRPIGIPEGRAKKALWSLLSKRLVRELDGLQACDTDYYRRYGDVLKANQFKPGTPWLEEGLFSGPAEAASPMKFSILDSRAIGDNRVDVHLRFTYKQTYCCGQIASYEHYEGVATAILENGGSSMILYRCTGMTNCFVCPMDIRSAEVVGGWGKYPTERTIPRIWRVYYVAHGQSPEKRVIGMWLKWPGEGRKPLKPLDSFRVRFAPRNNFKLAEKLGRSIVRH